MSQRFLPLLYIAVALALALAGCTRPLQKAEPAVEPSAPSVDASPLRFTIEAGMNDTWNAVGQLLVRMPGIAYDGRAQMLGLNAVRYRGESLMVLTRALPLSDAVTVLTTEVAMAAPDGKLLHSDAAADIMARLERELPAEIERVRAGLAAQEKAARQTRKKKPTRK